MSSIFPQDSTEVINNIIISKKTTAYGKSPVFLFETGEFKLVDGKVYIAEGIEVLRNWIEKTLRTERFRYPIYSSDYGVTLEEIAARNLSQAVYMNEIKSQITEALLQDARIANVGEFAISMGDGCLNVQFEVETFESKKVTMEVNI